MVKKDVLTPLASETIREFTDSRGIELAIDRETGVIAGVKLLGLTSTNGRTYLKEAVARAIGLYENAKVNVDHAVGRQPDAPRSYSDRIGVIRNVRIEPGDGGLRGDLYANPKHQLFEQLAWDAANSPQSVGFSHNIQAMTRRERGGKIVVEEITRVQSVDLVADPATTRGLFEQDGDQIQPLTEKENEVELKDVTLSFMEQERPELLRQIRADALTEHANSEEAKARDAEQQKLIESHKAKVTELTEQVDRYKAVEKLQEQRDKIEKVLGEAKLPEALVSDVFRQTLIEAKDEAAVKSLIEDRAAMAKQMRVTKPQSQEQHLSEGAGMLTNKTAKELATRWVA
jgi:hypothetical protein